jgi:hypothetical protein
MNDDDLSGRAEKEPNGTVERMLSDRLPRPYHEVRAGRTQQPGGKVVADLA